MEVFALTSTDAMVHSRYICQPEGPSTLHKDVDKISISCVVAASIRWSLPMQELEDCNDENHSIFPSRAWGSDDLQAPVPCASHN